MADSYCCEAMRREVESSCAQHPSCSDCPDALVGYSAKFREYGLIAHAGGTCVVGISFCPWCGARLPDLLRDEWFSELERLGIDPWSGEVPDRFQSAAWWQAGQGRSHYSGADSDCAGS